jgi:hypothetical protein
MKPRPGWIRRASCAVVLLCWCASAALAQVDAPYVMRNASGVLESWTVESTAKGPVKRVVSVAPGALMKVSGVGDVPPFNVRLREPAADAADEVKTGANTPIFVVADTHGEYEILVGMLRKQRIVDEKLHWKFGRGQLVILGDVFDRGAHQTEILWLFYQLEAEARAARGALHLVLGNHETMELLGDGRYLNPRYRDIAGTLGVRNYSQLFDAGSVLGQWLRSKPAVLKLNGLLCLHGGISRELVDRGFTLHDINDTVRGALARPVFNDAAARERAEFVFGQAGPLWYRGYFPAEANGPVATADDVAQIRKFFGVEKVLVGHTKVPTITPLYDGAVIAVQVYPTREADGRVEFEALWIRGGQFLRARPDGATEPILAR